MKNFFFVLAIGMLLFISNPGFAQNINFTLIDAQTFEPINDAIYTYSVQGKTSDVTDVIGITKNGIINLEFNPNATLSISHINYGTWEMSPAEIKKYNEIGEYFRSTISVQVHPVTVYGVHEGHNTSESVNLTYTDKMAHDAGSLIQQSSIISGIKKGGNYGIDPVLRGFKYDQLNIVIDGAQSATAACPNRMDPPTSQVAPNMISRVEIYKGPHALRYGSGFGGTINFVPQPIQFSDSLEFFGRITGGYESNGELIRSENQIGIRGNSYELIILGAYSEGTDYTAGNDSIVQADFMRNSVGAKLGIKLSNKQRLQLSVTKNHATDADFPTLPMDLRKDNTVLYNLRHDIRFYHSTLESWSTSVFGSFVNHKMDNLSKVIIPRNVNAVTSAETYNFGGRTEGVWNFASEKLYFGSDYKVEGATGTREREILMGPMTGKIVNDNVWQDAEIRKTGIFGEYQIYKDSITFILSSRIEVNNASISDPDTKFISYCKKTTTSQFNPSVSLGMITPINKQVTFGIWLGSAQRSGSLSERYINYFPIGLDPYEIIGNAIVKPEQNKEVDVTFNYKKETFSISFDMFAAHITNYISSVVDTMLTPRMPTSPGVRQVTNLDKAEKVGFELNVQQTLSKNIQQSFVAAFTYGRDITTNIALPEIAPFELQYTIGGKLIDSKLKPQLVFRYVAAQEHVSDEFGELPSKSFSLLDFKLHYSPLKNIHLHTGINNIFNVAYYEHLSRPLKGTNTDIYSPGRNVFITLNITF